MKKLQIPFAILLTFMVIMYTPCSNILSINNVYAASASLNGPQTVRGGDTITLTLNLSAPGSYGLEGSLSYDSSVVTLVEIKSAVNGWKVDINGNKIVAYDDALSNPLKNGQNVITAIFKVKNVSEGTNINISITNIIASDGSAESNAGNAGYSATVAPPLSGNANLSGLSVAGITLTPAFSPDTISYDGGEADFSVSSLSVSATAADSRSTVSVTGNSLSVGDNTVSITVKAENGTVKTYTIHIKREQDPNYVPSNDASISSITLSTGTLSPAFSTDITDYVVYLPYETASLDVSGTAAHPLASSEGTSLQLTGSKNYTLTVTGIAEDGTRKTYNITAVVMPEYKGGTPSTETVDNNSENETTTEAETTAPDNSDSNTEDNSDSTADEGSPVLNIIITIILIIIAAGAGFGICCLLTRKGILH